MVQVRVEWCAILLAVLKLLFWCRSYTVSAAGAGKPAGKMKLFIAMGLLCKPVLLPCRVLAGQLQFVSRNQTHFSAIVDPFALASVMLRPGMLTGLSERHFQFAVPEFVLKHSKFIV